MMLGLEIIYNEEVIRVGMLEDCDLFAIISYMKRDGCIATLGKSNPDNQTREWWWNIKKLAPSDKIKIRVTKIDEESRPMEVESTKTSRRKWSRLDSFYALQQELRNEGIDVDRL